MLALTVALASASARADGFATDTASLNARIVAANASASDYAITIQNGITLTAALAAIDNVHGATVTIRSAAGSAFTIDGNDAFQIFTVKGGAAAFENLTLANGLARGGDGLIGQDNRLTGGGGGGGGLGAGGGLFVAAGASVDLAGVSFADNRAVGGDGGATAERASNAGGAGGGLNGAAGAPGGAADGGSGGAGDFGAGGGGGGGGKLFEDPDRGGSGGSGGFGAGGAGAGGGLSNGAPGAAGTGGGQGGAAGSGYYAGGGGGGAGFGGAIFVDQGSAVTLRDTLISSGNFANAVAGGAAGDVIAGGARPAGAGLAAGQAIYLRATTATISVNAATSPAGVAYAGTISGDGGLVKRGGGLLALNAANSFSGDFTLDGGTVSAGHDTALGSGLLLVKSGTLDIQNGVSIGNIAVLENDFAVNVGSGASALYAGAIQDAGGSSFGLTKTGDGTLRLSGANNYAGATIVAGGVLLIESDGALPNLSDVTVNAAGTLQIKDGLSPIPFIGSLAGAGKVVIGTGSMLRVGYNSVSTVFSGELSGGGSLFLDSDGKLTLSGTSRIGGSLVLCDCSSPTLEIDGGSLRVGAPLGGGGGIGLTGGTLRVINGGTLHMVDASGMLAVESMLEVSGAGSTVTSEGLTGIGGAGPAGITISAGGVVNSRLDAAIEGADTSSKVTVTGAGSTWNVGGSLFLAGYNHTGTGSLVISAGGVVNAGAITWIGSNPDPALGLATANVTVTGAGSALNTDSGIQLGFACSCGDRAGLLTIADGGIVNAAAGTVIGAFGTLNFGSGGLAGSLVTPEISNNRSIIADFTGTATLAADISGAGSLTKQGSGTLMLTGANSYTGSTVLKGGVLSVSADANLGHSTSLLALDGGTLRVTGTGFTQASRPITLGSAGGSFDIADAANVFTLNQALSGTGGLGKAGAGTLLMTGAQNYSGATSVTAGMLRAGATGAFSAGSAFTVGAGATLDLAGFNQSIGSLAGSGSVALGSANLAAGADNSSTTFSGAISGTGSLTKQGTGTLTLTGANNYSGGTTISAGTLAGDATSLQGPILNNAALVFDQGSAGTFAGAISGTGSLTKQGAGTLTLTGANNYSGGTTVSAGTLAGDAASLQGAIVNNAALVFDQGSAGTFAGTISGTGSLAKHGTGTLTLTGANGYSGGTTISGGTLVGNTTSLQGPILNNAALVFDQTTTGTFAGTISGTGSLAKHGTGTLTLTGANSYSGGTTISGGTLVGNTTSLQGAVLNNAALVFDQAETGAFAGAISGIGSLTKRGAGTLTLTGANSYSGGTTISAGTLAGTTSSLHGPIVNDGALVFDQAETGTFAGAISGIGSLTKRGAGTLTLTGANSYSGGTTISAGTLAGTTSSLHGPIVNDGALVFDQAATGTFSGAISGTGALAKLGTGSLNLTGTSTLSGPTSVNAGLLAVNGSLANSVVTVSGGVLGGNGTVGGVVVNGGMVAPGNSIGTLNVTGNVGFAAGTVYQVELNGTGASDRIVATGAATLGGGQVQVLAATGLYAQSTRYGILTAQGGVTGQFAGATSDLAFLTPVLSYESNGVVLTMARNDVDFGPGPTPDPPSHPPAEPEPGPGPDMNPKPSPRRFVAVTRNQAGVAVAAQSLGSGNRVYETLLGTTAEQARAGFELLSGEAHAQAVAVAGENSHLVREAVLDRLRAPLDAPAPGGTIRGSFAADLPGRKSDAAMPAPDFGRPRFTLWGEAIGTQGSTDRDGNAAPTSRRGGGMLFGAELEQGQWRLGAAGGYIRTGFDSDARRSSGELASFLGALYGGARIGAVALRAGAAYAWNDVDVRRSVGFPGFSDHLRLDGGSATAQAFAEIGYGFGLGRFALEPFAQIAAVNIRTERNVEQGGAAALAVLGRDQTLGFTTLGLRAEMRIADLPLVARGMLGWRYAFGDVTPTADLAFLSGGVPFQTYAAPLARNTLLAEAGLAWKVSNAVSIGVSYSAALSDKARDQAVRGRIDIAF